MEDQTGHQACPTTDHSHFKQRPKMQGQIGSSIYYLNIPEHFIILPDAFSVQRLHGHTRRLWAILSCPVGASLAWMRLQHMAAAEGRPMEGLREPVSRPIGRSNGGPVKEFQGHDMLDAL